MARGIFLVEARPASADRLDEFNTWYDEIHIPQILSFDGFVSARRFEPVDEEGPFVTIYEMEADDLAAALAGWRDASRRGETDRSDVVQSDPPPRARLLTQIAPSAP
jgi:hypothetical protein